LRWRLRPFFNREHNAVWVPAFAGTTRGGSSANARHDSIPDSPIKQQRGHASAFPRRVFARGDASFAFPPEVKREQGMPGARYTRGLVCNKRKRCAHEHTGEAEAFRHPLRNGFTVYSVLSPATNSSCHRHLRINGASRPVGRSLPPRIWRQQRASGPHGFTVR
jgi:hypothetical protein